MLAHRAAWLLWRGDLPGPEFVVTPCRQRALCVQPEHLQQVEAAAHSRRSLINAHTVTGVLEGERHPNAKLLNAQVLAIVDLRDRLGWTFRRLAEQFGVTDGTIAHILAGREWRSVTGRRPPRAG
jgi:hypothetical protein